MRARLSIGAGLMLAALTVTLTLAVPTLLLPTPAQAAEPVRFGSSNIVDEVGALGERESEVTAALDTLYNDTRVDLYVVFVDSFTGVSGQTRWSDQTAIDNGLGTNDILLAVATEDRQYEVSVESSFALTDAQLADLESSAIEPYLREDDWAGAAIGAAEGIAASMNGDTSGSGSGSAPNDSGSGTSTASSGSGAFWVIALGLAALVVLTIVLLRRRSQAGPGAGARGRVAGPPPVALIPLDQLKQQAGSALVHTDDAVKTSEEELGFAVASYGTEATVAFRAALDDAESQLLRAFTLQQKLDDVEPDSDEQRRAWYSEIIDLCARANAGLDAEAEDFDELRQLEARAPEAAASVAAELAALTGRVDAAANTLTKLGQQYSASALAPVADNIEQARDRMSFAAAELADARVELGIDPVPAPAPTEAADTAGADAPTGINPGAAAIGIRAAEEAVDQAALLLGAIDRRAAELAAAAATVIPALRDLESDLVTARGLPTGGPGAASAALPGAIAASEQAVNRVTAALGEAGRTDPIDLATRLETANSQMDDALQDVRDAAALAQRAQSALAQTLLVARSQISAAHDFITARRGGVGATARTRLAEASRHLSLAEATAPSDAPKALAYAQRAHALAAESLALAQSDVNTFSQGGPGGQFGGQGGQQYGGQQGGSGSMGAVLGGLLIGSLLGGGGNRGGGMFGGGGGMFGGGGGGRRGGGGGFGSPGSFGGGGTRSRRGGGGRF
ncbi:TPM domain-containing protein [Cryobacterium melibiosiphilum]|uniref:TPM domain-containing protein n=1 Tax=Cryobacterium melibiosiphilum TaxID=995039 RepID=A0A3A5MBK3_9MICO|nr:TPM domain-containing protein [Cryobacterium melibiosiphilum]RJT87500.1 TPM domain-containing protein [Cryobacterium melibiosiphilum]